MPTESFLVTALPHSADPGAPFHVSLHISHRLTPQGVVDDFPHVRSWTELVREAEVRLFGHRPGARPVEIAARVVGTVDPGLWAKVFPGDLAVTPWQVKDLTSKPWRTFPAHRMDVHARGMHAAAMTASPVVGPQPTDLSTTEQLLRSLHFGPFWDLYQRHRAERADDRQTGRRQTGEGDAGTPGGGLLDSLLSPEGKDYDAQVTKQLDTSEPGRVKGTVQPSTGPWSVTDALSDVHAARRYFQRDEDASPYRESPDPGAKPPPGPVAPPAEFHQRAARIGDVSPLLRALGLVLDLVVEDVTQLAGLASISASVTVTGLDNRITTQPRTRCSTAGRLFTAVSSTGRWDSGMLRLGDEDQFTLLELDPDASALKLEQYLRTLPRLLALELNRSEGSGAAPPSLRSTGFSLAEQHRATALHTRVQDAPARAQQLMAGAAQPLALEQLTRGLRLEVWDDVSRRWHSLHRRLVTVVVDGFELLTKAQDEAFLQGAALSESDTNPTTAYAHEVLAGWDGWSLAAPRPEKVVVHEDGDEMIRGQGSVAEPGHEPVSITSLAHPGTLPKLRYGRSYSFRAYAVDLAGNSRGAAAPPAGADPGWAREGLGMAERILATRRTAMDGSVRRAREDSAPRTVKASTSPLAAALRGLTAEQRRAVAPLHSLLAANRPPLRTDRRQTLEQTFDRAVSSAPYVLARSDADTPAEVFAEALSSTMLDDRGLAATDLKPVDVVAKASDVVTVPRPFLRWAPLIEPAVVPRHPYTWGESLLRMVIRSGVAADGVLTPPGDYAASHATLGWRADSQRHLVPPKSSLVDAEMHGALDKAISTVGKATAAIRKKWLGLALRESGTFLQPEVADPDRPGELLPVAGLSFHLAASAAPLSDPVTGTPVAPPTPDTLKRGDPLLPGQYAVHDVDALVTPYLPDPVATGVSLVFPEADPVLRQAETAAGHLGVQSLTLRYPGSWPLHEAYRLVVQHGEQLDGVVEGNRLTISVPPGEQLRVRLSSAMDRASLRVFGLWRTLHAKIRDVPQLEEAAADGWLWWLTPAAEMTLVHAVPRPVEAPSFALLRASRSPDETTARLLAAVKVHAPSTDRLDLEASWVEQHDDLAKPGPETVTVADVACHTSVGYDESLLILFGEKPPKPLHAGFHHFGDTRHRTVDYTLRATTRYREFFPTEVANDKDSLSRISVPTRVVVPSTKRPVKTVVRDVLPLFRWSDETQVAQPFGVRRTRRAGLRLYLDRPWHTTGDGELLGVVLGEHATRSASGEPVSQWASDPVWGGQEGPDNANDLPLLNVASLLGGDPAGQPVRGPDDVLGEDGAVRKVLGYRPEYNSDRRLWFVDIALTPGPAFWPFVRLAVARYQPSSLLGLALGPVVQCDYAQLAPERSLVVARTDDGQVKVAVSGAIGNPRAWKPPPVSSAGVEDLAASRTMHVRLERRVPEIGTDLGWQVLSTDVLPVLSTVESIVTWEGTVTLARPHGEPARPGRGGTGDLRIVVEEVERLEADPSGDGALRTSSRVVYADEVVL